MGLRMHERSSTWELNKRQISEAPLLVQQVWSSECRDSVVYSLLWFPSPPPTNNSFVEILAPKDAGISSWGLKEP